MSPLGPNCRGDLISIHGWRVFFKKLLNKKCFSFVHERIPRGGGYTHRPRRRGRQSLRFRCDADEELLTGTGL